MTEDGTPGRHGFLALLQLLASAATDRRLSPATLRALVALSRYAGPDGTCCVALARLAPVLGVTRQAVQKALRPAERYGYIVSMRRYRKSGGEGAKVFAYNMELEGANACPVPRTEGEQPPEVAPGSNRWGVQGEQPLGVAHNRSYEQTRIKQTNATLSGAQFRKSGASRKTAGSPSGRMVQPSLLLPITGGAFKAPQDHRVLQAVQVHNVGQRNHASGRLWQRWCNLDPGLALFELIGDGGEDVAERALDLEVHTRGRGCAYIAGAVERASIGRVRASDILAGHYRQAASS